MTAAIVRITYFDLLSSASSSWIIVGEGCGWSSTAAFASLSAQWFPTASVRFGPLGNALNSTWAGTFRTATCLLHRGSASTGFRTGRQGPLREAQRKIAQH
jgi:hypothetical protein